MKHIASLITGGRIVGAFCLLLTQPLSIPFYVLYCVCCVSDIFDGYVARKTKTTSKFGEILDSVADYILVAVLLVIFVPLLSPKQWMLYWAGTVALIRLISLVVGGIKYRAFASLHTVANKITGFVLACFPVLYHGLGLSVTAVILCGITSLSALEELLITVSAKNLDRNIASLLDMLQ